MRTKEERREYPLTDAGNGEAFADQWHGRLRFDATCGRWRVFNGKRWIIDDVGRAMDYAKQTARNLLRRAAGMEDTKVAKLAKWALRTESRDRLAAMLELAKSVPDMTVTADQWDADPWAFNVTNGTLNLRTGELRPHRAGDLLTKLAPVEYHRDADAPTWHRFLTEIFAGDDSLIEWFKRWHGYALAAVRTEHLLPVYHGAGANGKSTALDTIAHVMGDYADQAAPDLLTDSGGFDKHPTELADLAGKRLVIASETEKNRRLRVQLVKRLTGDEKLKGRFMRQDFFTFTKTFALVMVTNNKPRVDEDTEAVWRRLRLIPFSVVIPPERRNPTLPAKLKAEAPGILRWLVDGCLAWQRDGLGAPNAIERATGDYRAESDPLGDFMAECCLKAPDAWAASDTLRRVYESWCKERGEHPLSGRDFTEALRRHGGQPSKRYAGRGWAGIGILSAEHAREGAI